HGINCDGQTGCFARFAASLSLFGHRTSYAQPAFSKPWMIRALMSTCPFSTPCRAHVGSEWCRLCHDSPSDGIASHHTLRDLSRTSNSSLPKVWQIELIDHVTWWTSVIRTSPAQNSAVRKPAHDIVIRPPMTPGSRIDTATRNGNARWMRRMSRSLSRSLANRSLDVWAPSNSQP